MGCNVFCVCGIFYQLKQNLFDGVQLDVAICVPVHDVETVAYFKCYYLENVAEICVVPGNLHTTAVKVKLVFKISFPNFVEKYLPLMCTGSRTISYQAS